VITADLLDESGMLFTPRRQSRDIEFAFGNAPSNTDGAVNLGPLKIADEVFATHAGEAAVCGERTTPRHAQRPWRHHNGGTP
jgi:hypothetical protein